MSALVADVLSFAAVAGLLTIVPGLDTAMVLRSTAAHGRRHGVATTRSRHVSATGRPVGGRCGARGRAA